MTANESRLYRAPNGDLLLRSKKALETGAWAMMDHRGHIQTASPQRLETMEQLGIGDMEMFRSLPAVAQAIAMAGVRICGGRQRQPRCKVPGCSAKSFKLCDYPVVRDMRAKHDHTCPANTNDDQRKLLGELARCECPAGTCSMRICEKHTSTNRRGQDFCPAHAKLEQP